MLFFVDSPEEALRVAHAAELRGDLVEAESTLRDASKRWKREPEFKMRHGRILRKLGQDRQALKVFRSVLKAHPQRADAAQFAAESAQSLGKIRLAEKLWGRALAVGADSDVATTGLCRAMWLRGQKEEAWTQALQAFIQNGRNSRILHDFLLECSPIIGLPAPELDLLDIGTLESDSEPNSNVRGDLTLKPTNFGNDSMEAMAGISADALTAKIEVDEQVNLLVEPEHQASTIDMSALAKAKPTIASRQEIDLPDDLLDFD